MSEQPLGACAVYLRAFDVIGRRWTGAIIRSILAGQHRFSDIVRSIPGLSDRLLSERLKELEAEGVVVRTVTPETPVRIEYTLTEMGAELAPILRDIEGWAQRWFALAERSA